jgi:prefoldin alpha subunit
MSGNTGQVEKSKGSSEGGGNRKARNDASSDAAAVATRTTIQLDTLSLDELNQLQQQEESTLQALSGRYAALRQALGRINQGVVALSDLGCTANDGKQVMVPLTESVYVAGKIRDSNRHLVELGTGYYAEKSHKEAVAFLERKHRLVDRNLENLQAAIQATRQNLEAIGVTIQGKVLEIRAKQEGVRHREAVENA